MTSILLVESQGNIKLLKAKDVTLDTLFKKCGFRTNEHFGPRHTWNVRVKGESQPVTVALWAKNVGKSNFENKYAFPVPNTQEKYYGTATLVRVNTDNIIVNITPDTWDLVLKEVLKEIEDDEDCEVEDGDDLEEGEDDEEDEDEEEKLDKVCVKNGVLVVNKKKNEEEEDSEDEDEEESNSVYEEEEEEEEDEECDDEEVGGDDEQTVKKKKRPIKKSVKKCGIVVKKALSIKKIKSTAFCPVVPIAEELHEEPYDYSDLETE
jgi:hypothetical protein